MDNRTALAELFRFAPHSVHQSWCGRHSVAHENVRSALNTGGFVWIYSALFYITNGGVDIRLAQYIFAGLYLAVLALVLAIYRRANNVH